MVVEAVFAVVWTAIVQVAGPGAVLPRLAVRLIDGFAIGLHRDVGLADGRNWRRGGMLPFPYVLPLCGLAGASQGMAVDSSNRP